ncbi:MAG: hypothetical protein JWN88_2237 [Frankiales bacterium]|jgi:hypothetical protein|nr:hypothetical protein [Frankiales bacterium]
MRGPGTYGPAVTLPVGPTLVPEPFAAALVGLREALARPDRPGLELQEVPAPKRLAPYAVAVAAEIKRDDDQVASGRFVVLHDPDGQEGWRGDTRVVAFVSADVEAEMAADPALAQVGWSWLTESLHDRGAGHTAAGGTVTRTVSCRFGQIEDADEASEVEVRASWTPLAAADGSLDLGVHLLAWCDLLCATAGLPPPGVLALRAR